MKKINTTTWYVSKAYIFPCFNLMKAHIVDDDCNEYTATIKGAWIVRGYYSPAELEILDLEPYSREEWRRLNAEAEYSHHIIKNA